MMMMKMMITTMRKKKITYFTILFLSYARSSEQKSFLGKKIRNT